MSLDGSFYRCLLLLCCVPSFDSDRNENFGTNKISIACTTVQIIINYMATEMLTMYKRIEANTELNGAKENHDRSLSFATDSSH